MTATPEFKEKARRLMFNAQLKNFSTHFEMYTLAFGVSCDLDAAMADIISIIRTSEDSETAYTMVCHYLDSLEGL